MKKGRPSGTKGIKKDLELLNQRDNDLLQAYNQTLKEYGHLSPQLTKKFLIEKTLEKPAPQFYVSIPQAARIITNMVEGKTPENGRSCGRKK